MTGEMERTAADVLTVIGAVVVARRVRRHEFLLLTAYAVEPAGFTASFAPVESPVDALGLRTGDGPGAGPVAP